MDKPYKIKRYNKIYRRSRFSLTPFRVGLIVVAIAVLFFVGWAVYEPVYNFLTGNTPPAEEPSPAWEAPPASQEPEIPPAAEPETPETSEPPAQAETEPGAPAAQSEAALLGVLSLLPKAPAASQEPAEAAEPLRGVYLPADVMADEAALTALLTELQTGTVGGQPVNAVLFDMKDSTGRLLYASAVPTAVDSGAVAQGAFDGARRIQLIKDMGFTPIARVYAFRDHIASAAHLDLAVHYQGSEWAWLDNSADAGGRTWLNPYSAGARDYIAQILEECASLGLERLVLDGVQFPQGYALDLATYGEESLTKTRPQVLGEFMDELTAWAGEAGVSLSFYLPGPQLLGGDAAHLGGDLSAFAGRDIAAGAMPSLLGASFQAGETVLDNPHGQPYESVKAVADALTSYGEGSFALLQAYGSDGGTDLYGPPQLEEELQALRDAGIAGYVFYDPQGSYGES